MKVLIVQNKLMHYRIPIFNELQEKLGTKITVVHSGEKSNDASVMFDEISIKQKKINRFVLIKGLQKIANQQDVVIAMFDISWLSILKLALNPFRKYKFVFWGIGLSTNAGLGVDTKMDWLRFKLAKKADAMLLYSDYPIPKYIENGFKQNELYVAPNTIKAIPKLLPLKNRNKLVFLGSIYPRKNIEELIDAIDLIKEMPLIKGNKILDIIGSGDHLVKIEKRIKDKKLTSLITISGAIYDKKALEEKMKEAIACVSPGQAGLSVLECFSKGIPFITKYDAITGGESLNIKHGINGFRYQGGKKELSEIILKLFTEEEYRNKLAEEAYDYYQKERTSDKMVEGFLKCIKFCEK